MASYLTAWDWKTEPDSPTCSVLEGSEDVWLFGDNTKSTQPLNNGSGDEKDDEKLSQPSATLTRAQVAAQLLEGLDEWVKEETFPDWLEQKIDLQIFEDIPPLDIRSKYKLDSETLFQDFESVCGAVALTPPQSPPYNAEPYLSSDHTYVESLSLYHSEPVLLSLSAKSHVQSDPIRSTDVLSDPKPNYALSYVDDMIMLDQLPQSVSQPDVAMELAVVDELVRSRAEGMDVSLDPWENSSVSSPLGSSESEAVLSPPDTSNDSFDTDPEWIPESVNSPKSVAPKRKRGKPYGRPVEDKKLRKKEQNKNAATRYRQKKKQEVEVIFDEEKDLEDKNSVLQDKVTDLQREIKYLKGLMRDMFKAKGVL